MKRALSVKNILDKKHKELELEGVWLSAIGKPEMGGTWFVSGPSKNGKTSLTMMLTKYLTKFGRVYYNSFEEGDGLSIKKVMNRIGMKEVCGKWIMPDGGTEEISDMIERLKRKKSPNIAVIDSVQFSEMKFSDYKYLKKTFPKKIFIYVSHVEGNLPQGEIARKIYKDACVTFRIEGFRAFPVSRYGGGEPVVISEEKAAEYNGW